MDHASINSFRRNVQYVDDTLPIEDILSQGLNLVLEKDQITVWTVLGCRVLLDAQSLLGQDLELSYKELKHFGSSIVRKLDLRLGKDHGLEARDGWSWGEQSSEVMVRVWRTIMCWIAQNPFASSKKDMLNDLYTKYGGRTHSEIEDLMKDFVVRDRDPYYFFKQNVLHSGTMRLSLTLDFEQLALSLHEGYGAIFYIAYLYHAGKHLQWIDREWHDLEYVIRQQQNVLFGSNSPQTLKEMYGLFRSRVGMPAAASAPKRRVNQQTSRARIPKLKPNPVLGVLRRYCAGSTPMHRCIFEIWALKSQIKRNRTYYNPLKLLQSSMNRCRRRLKNSIAWIILP